MFHVLYSRCVASQPVKIESSYTRLTPVDDVLNGTIVRKSEFRKSNNAEIISKFNSHDFDVSNLISCGAFNALKPVIMDTNSDFSILDNLENHLDYVSSSENS